MDAIAEPVIAMNYDSSGLLSRYIKLCPKHETAPMISFIGAVAISH